MLAGTGKANIPQLQRGASMHEAPNAIRSTESALIAPAETGGRGLGCSSEILGIRGSDWLFEFMVDGAMVDEESSKMYWIGG